MALRPLVFCGPSGGGKSTLVKRLFEVYPGKFAFSVSHTTRQPRPGERHGVEYYFVPKEVMHQAIEKGEFIENAEFAGNLYGTSKQAIKDVQKTGKICILDVDLQGVRSLKKTDLQCLYLFVKPPSMQVLTERLKNRQTESDESLQRRIETAMKDMRAVEAEPELFDNVIINDDLDIAFQELKKIVDKELHRIPKNGETSQ